MKVPLHSSENTHLVCDYVKKAKPATILDVGCGSGSHGLLFRDLLDRARQRYHRADWRIVIDAVEVWADYITPVHTYIYNSIVISDVREIVRIWPDRLKSQYDLIFFGDVLEHLSVLDGTVVLNGLREHTKRLLIATPVAPCPQAAYLGNTHEIHVSKWTADMLKDLDFTVLTVGSEIITAHWSAV